MANSYTEHSKKLRQKTMEKWGKENKERRYMNNYASSARSLARECEFDELDKLEIVKSLLKEKIDLLEK